MGPPPVSRKRGRALPEPAGGGAPAAAGARAVLGDRFGPVPRYRIPGTRSLDHPPAARGARRAAGAAWLSRAAPGHRLGGLPADPRLRRLAAGSTVAETLAAGQRHRRLLALRLRRHDLA